MFGRAADQFEGIIEGSIANSQDLERAFRPSDEEGRIQEVVSTLGARPTIDEK